MGSSIVVRRQKTAFKQPSDTSKSTAQIKIAYYNENNF
jgi:hypothetical protein